MRRWLRRISIGLVVAVIVMGVTGTLLLRGSLATLDGDHALAGLSAPVQIARDAGGVVSIDAPNEADAARALGFVHAQERFFEMDLLRRSAAGELAELFGAVALPRDRQLRVHRMRARVRAMIASLDADQHAVIAAYTDGVNAGLDALRVRPWAYLLLQQAPVAWRAEDSGLVVAAMAFDLQDASNRREFMLDRLDRYLSPELMVLLAADGSEFDAPLVGEPRAPITLPAAPNRSADGGPVNDDPAVVEGAVDGVATGSNNFAVAGSLTRDGRAILADDMHLGLRAPNIWFRAALHYSDPRVVDGKVAVSGFSLPGVPGIVAGSNGHVAWGYTNSYGDWLDWVQVHWSDRAAGVYQTAAGEARIETVDEIIRVKGAADETLRIEHTRWGPIVHREGEGSGEKHALALAWTAHRAGAIDLGLLAMARARNLDEAMAIGRTVGMPAQNLLVADRAGRIGWTLTGRVPQRLGNCDPLRSLDPRAGCEWAQDWLSSDVVPRLIDPADGRLWTANSRVADGEGLRLIGAGSFDLGARQRQIRDRLRAQALFDEADLLAIQLDTRALFLERWWQLLRSTVADSALPELQRLAAASAKWEGQAEVDAVSYRLARGFRAALITKLAAAILADAKAGEGARWQEPVLNQFEPLAWALLSERPSGWLGDAPDAWQTLLTSTAVEMVQELEAVGPLGDRRWGERNTARICHPLAAALPAVLAQALCRPSEPLPGDSHLPRVQGPSFGASQRMVVSPGHEVDGIINAPAGQSGHPLSPFWDSGHADWARGEATPFLPGAPNYRVSLTPE